MMYTSPAKIKRSTKRRSMTDNNIIQEAVENNDYVY